MIFDSDRAYTLLILCYWKTGSVVIRDQHLYFRRVFVVFDELSRETVFRCKQFYQFNQLSCLSEFVIKVYPTICVKDIMRVGLLRSM